MNFKIDDKVQISPDSEFYGTGKDNPSDVVGIITDIYGEGGLNIMVKWPRVGWNLYKEEDLVLVGLNMDCNIKVSGRIISVGSIEKMSGPYEYKGIVLESELEDIPSGTVVGFDKSRIVENRNEYRNT